MQIRVEGLSVASEPGTKSLILSPSVHWCVQKSPEERQEMFSSLLSWSNLHAEYVFADLVLGASQRPGLLASLLYLLDLKLNDFSRECNQHSGASAQLPVELFILKRNTLPPIPWRIKGKTMPSSSGQGLERNLRRSYSLELLRNRQAA